MEQWPNLLIHSLGIVVTILGVLVQSQSFDEVNHPLPPLSLDSLPPPPPRSPSSNPPPSHPSPPSKSYSASPPPPRRAVPPQRHHKKEPSHRRPLPPPPHHEQKLNTGKMIGLLFAGIAAILQVGFVGFLAFKRRQLFKS